MSDENTNKAENSFLFQVNLGGMIDILSNHLYSSPDVFIRELLQNGADAIRAREKTDKDFTDKSIDIKLYDDSRLVFCDCGTGLTEEEIHKFLAVIGQSSKHNISDQKEKSDYIGRFGIGLLSCFLVSDEICVRTRSMKTPDVTLEWRGKPDGTYTINECEQITHIGTQIILESKDDSKQYFTAEKISELVRYYAMPLPYPIYMCTQDVKTRLNPPFPQGKSAHAQVMDLGKMIFGCDFLDFIPLQSKNNTFSGVAFIMAQEVAPTARHSHRIYLKNMLLTENGERLLPKWAFFLRCFINTDGLRPTASREDFYEDDKLIEAREELHECITEYLEKLSDAKPQIFARLIRTHRLAVSSVAADDDSLYRAFFPYLTFETSFGSIIGRQLLEYTDEITYTNYIDEYRQISSVFLARGRMLVNAGYTYVRQLIGRMSLINENAVVSELNIHDIDDMLYDAQGISVSEISRFNKKCSDILSDYDCRALLKRFEPEELPVLYTIDDNALMLRDIQQSIEKSDEMFSDMLNSFAEELDDDTAATLYINSDNSLVKRLIDTQDAQRLECCIKILYVQALLTGGYPMHSGEMQVLNDNLLQLLDWSL
ncbi:MAG: HSP90 family protein [Oscillospiraceae bacterium]|nr:HSP90 family protein [Oscillospiraceae bacterium]